MGRYRQQSPKTRAPSTLHCNIVPEGQFYLHLAASTVFNITALLYQTEFLESLGATGFKESSHASLPASLV